MSRMQDHTLLSKLGFADPDKKDPLHDLGCQYITRPEVFNSIGLKMPNGDPITYHPEYRPVLEHPLSKGYDRFKTTIGFIDAAVQYRYEYRIDKAKLTGQLAAFQDYSDASAYSERGSKFLPEHKFHVTNIPNDTNNNNNKKYKYHVPQYEIYVSDERCFSATNSMLIEVKIAPVGLGDILRQIKLYKEYIGNELWLLAAAFEISPNMAEGLRQEGIYPVQLGEKFQKWAMEQRLRSFVKCDTVPEI